MSCWVYFLQSEKILGIVADDALLSRRADRLTALTWRCDVMRAAAARRAGGAWKHLVGCVTTTSTVIGPVPGRGRKTVVVCKNVALTSAAIGASCKDTKGALEHRTCNRED